jgi:hypothetical protein
VSVRFEVQQLLTTPPSGEVPLAGRSGRRAGYGAGTTLIEWETGAPF